ncbi:hypothetical protein, partial [Ruminococcus callidus]
SAGISSFFGSPHFNTYNLQIFFFLWDFCGEMRGVSPPFTRKNPPLVANRLRRSAKYAMI